MKDSEILKEFKNNCEANIKQLRKRFWAYDLAVACCDAQEQQIKEIRNSVLADNCFYAAKDFKRGGIKAGDRITEEDCVFLLSKDDCKRYSDLSIARLAKEKITDTSGRYMVNWPDIKCQYRRSLVEFIIANIIPYGMQEFLEGVERNITLSDRLVSIMRGLIGKEA